MIPYIIKVAVILAGCLAFYKIFLQKETFYKVNRYVLIACLVISFGLPLIPIPQQLSFRKAEQTTVINNSAIQKTEPVVNKVGSNETGQTLEQTGIGVTHTKFSTEKIINWIILLYWFGVIAFGINFLLQVIALLYSAYARPVIIDGAIRIVEVEGDKAPCSFGNNIFINPEKYDWDTYNQIIQHEKVHIRQKHSIDILVAELVLIFQWFNPFAWMYRKEVESNLEFLTDEQLVQHDKVEKSSYQISLLKVSTPHFPMSLTTNYNQSLLKKRIAMMNAKKSNVHSTWKYFFLLPLLVLFASLLNEPVAYGQDDTKKEKQVTSRDVDSEGYWFAIIKDDKVNIRFSDEKMDDDDFDITSGRSSNGSTFKLSELGNIPKGTSGTFSINREAGRMEMTGKFDGNTGMGTYKFVADKAFVDYMNAELKEKLDDDDQMAFFFINIRKDYLQMLKKEGFSNITKDDIIPMAALKIDAAYIKSIKDAGFKDVDMKKLVPLKALHVDAAYIKEIRDAGYKNVTTDQLVTFKAQGIDKSYITKMRELKGDDNKDGDDDAEDIVSYKALNIDEAYVNSFKSVGLTNMLPHQLVSFKAVGVTPEFIKGWHAAGFKDIIPEVFVGMKAQNVTPEFLKSFTDLGFKNVKPDELVAFKALGITPEYVKTFEAAGYKVSEMDKLTALKAQNITPEYIKSFESVGFKDIDLDEIVSVKAVGVTPEYIKDMRAKGFNYDKLSKYVTLKSMD